ncbi:ABC-F family ATP-binding cassette domain-containing protein [Bacillus sp. V5-8f]|uniref:ABC-F family ATP-binding cassette domain-containing protein n=1 Tax=Bacillus sp. V5-8f TaxID=2053044 RepID=UPI000C77122A|nr:ABC-F family ATP-binding cassette domain-containing protein [Bacillus sp. V5-8f]PLT34943.1 multidrug ABC transporter ATP-binding protein [Bacillus sp. V5-8f]
MKVFSIENLEKMQGEKLLFKDISFSITEGDKIGIIGVNGTGKSTLLNIIAGIEDSDRGSVDHPRDYTISYLSQAPMFEEGLSVLEYLFAAETPIFSLIKEYEKALLLLQKCPEDAKVQERLLKLQQSMDENNAWDTNANAKTILTKLGLYDFSKKLSEMSGGQKKRAALARTLIENPDLLILDEPTNHLDYESITWLEDYLVKYQKSVLFVTHDRYFLDNVSRKIWELAQGYLHEYKGNYADFLESKALREENESVQRAKKESLFKKELAWIRTGAKARTTKQKARIQRFESLEGDLKDKNSSESLEIELNGSRLGKKVLELKDISKSFGGQLILNNFSFLFKPGDRIGIVGNNGTGKSTLLNIFSGRVNPDEGEIETGQTVKLGYYTQENEDMDENLRMIEYIRETAESITLKDGSHISAAQMLERFLFPMNTHGTLIRKLSGGEKRRLYLLKILMSSPNVLLLDEPTNDLDTQTLTVLEDYLESFAGVVITVSHDRYFLDKTCKQLLVFKGKGNIDFYFGQFSEFLEESKAQAAAAASQKPSPAATAAVNDNKKKKKLSYKETKEWEEIEGNMQEIEDRLKAISEEMAIAGSDYAKVKDLSDEERELTDKLDEMMERWAYLAEKVEG